MTTQMTFIVISFLILIVFIYWLFRPENHLEIANSIPQQIPPGIPPGHTIYLERPSHLLDRFEMFYRATGRPEGKTVILLHGAAGSSDTTWYNTYQALESDYYVIAPDLRGHGLSMQPYTPTSIEQMAGDVHALMGALKIGKAHVVGHSMGGLVAMQLAHDHPDNVISVTLIGTAARLNRGVFFEIGFALYPLFVRAQNRLSGWQQENHVRAASYSHLEVDPAYHEWVFQKRAFNQTESFVSWWRAIGEFDGQDLLKKIEQPALIIFGENDNLIGKNARQELMSLLPQAEVATIAGAHHSPQVQFSDEVNPILLDFFRNHPE